MSEAKKIIDERETHTKKQKKSKAEKNKGVGTEAIVKGWELNDFVVHLS